MQTTGRVRATIGTTAALALALATAGCGGARSEGGAGGDESFTIKFSHVVTPDTPKGQAALKFKYKPKVVNGEPIDVAGVRNLITFELSE